MPRPSVIHPARPQDLPALRRLFRAAVASDFAYFPETYRGGVLRQNTLPRLARAALHPRRIVLVARADSLTGFLIGSLQPDGVAHIYWLFVDPTARGRRLGSELLEAGLRELRRAGASKVSLVTHRYRKFYERAGFHFDRVQLLPELFGDNEMHVMTLDLGAKP